MTNKESFKLWNNPQYQRLYKEYLNFMDKMANEDNMVFGYNIHLEYKKWIKDNKISQNWLDMMEKDLMKEEGIK